MNALKPQPKPWYREPWPWLLMAGPAIVVVAGFVTAWLAVRSNDGLVEDDYYKQGLAVSQQLARDQVAADLDLSAELVVGGANGLDLRLFLTAPEKARSETLKLRIVHPTRAGADQELVLKKDSSGFYVGRFSAPPTGGHWNVLLEDEGRNWRIAGKWNPDQQSAVRLVSVNKVSN